MPLSEESDPKCHALEVGETQTIGSKPRTSDEHTNGHITRTIPTHN